MITYSAPEVVQLNVTGPPEIGEKVGLLLNVRICTETVNVALAVTVPLPLVAVSTYVVVTVGFTVRHPDSGTVPIPSEIETVFAFSTCQQSCALPPELIVDGATENEKTRGTGIAVTVTLAVAEMGLPSVPVAIRV
jgi:hypothetical protein